MEWFATAFPALDIERLRSRCTLAALPALCSDVHELTRLDPGGDAGEPSCVWGMSEATRRPIRNDVRYESSSCRNALQRSVTTRCGSTNIHCSINTPEADRDFAESIAAFVENFRRGLAGTALACAASP
jgi:hypothetical protein